MYQSTITAAGLLESMRTDALRDVARLIAAGALSDRADPFTDLTTTDRILAELGKRLDQDEYDRFCDELAYREAMSGIVFYQPDLFDRAA